MKALYLFPVLLLTACGKKDEPQPSSMPTKSGVLVLSIQSTSSTDNLRLKPTVTFDVSNTPAVDYQRTFSTLADFPGQGTNIPFTYSGDCTMTLTVSVPRVNGGSDSYTPFFLSEVNVGSVLQRGLNITPHQVNTATSTTFTYILDSKSVK